MTRRRWCAVSWCIGVLLAAFGAAGCTGGGIGDRLSGSSSPPERDLHGQMDSPGEGSVSMRLMKF